MTRERWIGVGVVVVAALLAVLVFGRGPGTAPDGSGGVDPAPAPAPGVSAAPRPRPVPDRPAPAEVPAPAAAPVVPAASVTPELRQAYNYAMQDAVKEARAQCIDPWLVSADRPPAGPVTFVVDAVATDGAVSDIAWRGLGSVPSEVIDCAREAAWAAEWPDAEQVGEYRFQYSFTVTPPP